MNAPRSYVCGAEFDIEAHPFHGLTLTQNFDYQNGAYKQFQSLNRGTTTSQFAATGFPAEPRPPSTASCPGLPRFVGARINLTY